MTDAPKSVNYTEAMIATLHARYAEVGNEGLEAIATELQRSVTSVRMKLVADGLYVKPESKVTAKSSDKAPTKKEILRNLESILPPSIAVQGLMPATKDSLESLLAFFEREAAEMAADDEADEVEDLEAEAAEMAADDEADEAEDLEAEAFEAALEAEADEQAENEWADEQADEAYEADEDDEPDVGPTVA